jgi:excisionase family DNA binding protein
MDYIELPGELGKRYTAGDVARGLGVSYATVLDWLKRGLIRGTRDILGRWRIRHRAVRRALRDHREVQSSVARARLDPKKLYAKRPVKL